jgi:transposase InsO family protein
MGSTGDAYDNALAESSFASLETELIDRSSLADPGRRPARAVRLHRGFYNRQRHHSALAYLSPAEFERRDRSETMIA